MLSRNENVPHIENHHALTKTKLNMADAEMMFFPPYHTRRVDPHPTAGNPAARPSLRTLTTTLTPGNAGDTRRTTMLMKSRSKVVTPKSRIVKKTSVGRPQTPRLTVDLTPKIKKNEEEVRTSISTPPKGKQRIVPPKASAYARNFASAVGKRQATRVKGKNTEIVLPPRFRPDSTIPTSISNALPGGRREVWTRPSSNYHRPRNDKNLFIPQKNHESYDSFPQTVKMPVDMFPPEKARWVQLALEKLFFNGAITRKEMNMPIFQRKIGTLYDSSLDQRATVTNSVKNLTLDADTTAAAGGIFPNSSNIQFPSQETGFLTRQINGPLNGRKTSATSKKSDTPNSSKPSTPKSARSAPSTPRTSIKKGKGKQGSNSQLERKVSDALLHMLLKGMVDENKNTVENVDDATGSDGLTQPYGFLSSTEQKHVSTNTEIDEDFDDWAWMARASTTTAKFNRGKSGTTKTLEDLTSPWIRSGTASTGNFEPFLDIQNCFVFEGRVCPLETSKKPISSFAPLSESRRTIYPSTDGYFRKVVDVRGFDPQDITIKYSKSHVFVEAKQSAAEDRNYRIVREIVVLPRSMKITDLKVMRGRYNGRLVFEEQLADAVPGTK